MLRLLTAAFGPKLLFAAVQNYVRFLGYSGREMLAMRLSQVDPERTLTALADADSCNALTALGARKHFHQWKRREFITLLGGAAAAWPVASVVGQAQQGKIWKIGVLTPANPEPLRTILQQALREVGYVVGGNTWIEFRSADGEPAPTSQTGRGTRPPQR